MKYTHIILFVLYFFTTAKSSFQPKAYEIPVFDKEFSQELHEYAYHFVDTTREMELEEVYEQFENDKFQFSKKRFIGSTNDVYWLAYSFKNLNTETKEFVLEYNNFKMSDVKVFKLETLGSLPLRFANYNWNQPTASRELFSLHPSFPFILKPYQEGFFFIRLQLDDKGETNGGVFSDLIIQSEKSFIKSQQNQNFLFGLELGFTLMVCLLAILVYFATSDKAFLFYGLTILLLSLAIYTEPGILALHLWKEHFNLSIHYIISSLYFILTGQFVRYYLYTYKFSPKLNLFIYGVQALSLVALFAAAFQNNNLSVSLLEISGISFFVYIFAALKSSSKNLAGAKLFAIGWILYSFSVTYSFVMVNHGIVEHTYFNKQLVFYSFIAEMMIFTAAMAIRIKSIKQKKEKAQRVKTEFLSVMGHELKTPLNSILGMASSLSTDLRNPQDKEQAEQIANSSTQLSYLINDILDYSQLSSESPLQLTEFNLEEELESLISLYSLEADSKGLELKYETNTSTQTIVKGDLLRFKQIANNLVSNAIKFSDKGKVEIQTSSLKGSINLRVKDEGCGIAKEKQKHIFKPFYKEDSSINRSSAGTGIGLAVINKLVHYFGGSIKLSSDINQGACFDISFPWQSNENKKTLSQTETPKKNYTGKKVLLVDDNRLNLKVLEKLLQNNDLEIISLQDGQASIDWCRTNQPDLIFMDIQMPNINGIEASKQIRTLYKAQETPIVLVTAENIQNYTKEIKKIDIQNALAKPVNKKSILNELEKWL